jgi:uncharacterized membrane protein (GlpM family)
MTSPELMFWYAFTLKMAMTATIVVAASVAVERSGPFIGALIAALPTAAGPAYVILAIEHPPGFIAASAVGTMVASSAVSVFAAAYTLLAQRHGLAPSLGAATLLWFLVAAALGLANWTEWSAIALNVAVFAVTIPLTWRYRSRTSPPRAARTPYDIPLRALTAAVLVAIVTTLSSRIGSFASGMFAMYPIVLSSFIVILHPRVGGKAAGNVLAYAQVPLIGMPLGFLAVHYCAEPLGSWWALVIGLAVCIAWSGLLWIVSMRTTRITRR